MYPHLLSQTARNQFDVMQRYPLRAFTPSEVFVHQVLKYVAERHTFTLQQDVAESERLVTMLLQFEPSFTTNMISNILIKKSVNTDMLVDQLKRLYPYANHHDLLLGTVEPELNAMLNGLPQDTFTQSVYFVNKLVALADSLYQPPESDIPYMVYCGYDPIQDQLYRPAPKAYQRLGLPERAQEVVDNFIATTHVTADIMAAIDLYSFNPRVSIVRIHTREFVKVQCVAGHSFLFLPRSVWETQQKVS